MNNARSCTLFSVLSIMILSTLISLSVQADTGHKTTWGHGDIRYFHKYDAHIWYGGHWYHGGYQGRYGWWWVVAGVWYFYTVPVYPYPNPYVPAVVVVNPQPPATPAAPVATNYWYYCKAANGYYPYVSSCPGGWQQVPATPPPPEPPAPPQTTLPPPPG